MGKYDALRAQAMKWSVQEVVRLGKNPTFGLHTFWSQQDYRLMSAHWTLYLKRVCRRMELFGVRVYELTEHRGMHVHVVQSDLIPMDIVEQAQEGTLIGIVRQKKIWGGDVGRYLDKELRKQFRDGPDALGQRWRAFGDFPNVRIKDITVTGPWMDVWRDAWSTRERGAKRADVERDAFRMYRQWIEAGGEGGEVGYGDAWEDAGGETASGGGVPRSESETVGVPF